MMVTAAMGTVYGRRAMLGARRTMPGQGRTALPTMPPDRHPDVVGASRGMGWVAYRRRDHRAARALPLLATLDGSSVVTSEVLPGSVRRLIGPDVTAASAAAPVP